MEHMKKNSSNPYKPPMMLDSRFTLKDEDKELLMTFLFKILMDAKSISMKTLFSHHDDYLEFTGKMMELGLISIREDCGICSDYNFISIEFLRSIGELLGVMSEEEFEEFINIKFNKFIARRMNGRC